MVLLALCGCAPELPEAPPREGVVYLVAFGEVEGAHRRRAAWALEAATGRKVVHLGMLGLERGDIQGRHNAGRLLDRLLLRTPSNAYRVAGVTQARLRSTEHEHVIGYARRGERALVYSTSALPEYATEAAHRRRVRRIVTHELGHTYGAEHCHDTCVMRDIYTEDVDVLPGTFCPDHYDQAQRHLAQGPEHIQSLRRLGRERIRLGRWDEAVAAYKKVLHHEPKDPRARTAMGVALMARGELAAAEDAFVEATRSEPEAPQPYYGRAVLYAATQNAGRASAFLEMAVSRDGNAARAHRAAGILYQDVLDAPIPAQRHYESHVQRGGRDPEVIGRLVYLMKGHTVIITQPEVIIARWAPYRGLILARVDD